MKLLVKCLNWAFNLIQVQKIKLNLIKNLIKTKDKIKSKKQKEKYEKNKR